MTAARPSPPTEGGIKIAVATEAARRYLTEALDNLDTIERISKHADPLTALAVLGLRSQDGIEGVARAAMAQTRAAVDLMRNQNAEGER